MKISEKIYILLTCCFCILVVTGNLIYQKFVVLDLLFHKFELSAGAVLYPMTFFVTDLIAEFYGKERSGFCIKLGIFANIFVFLLLKLSDILPAAEWSKMTQDAFHQSFGLFGIAFAGSMIACYVSQFVDIRLYMHIKRITKDNHLWLRSSASTCISLLIDTSIVIVFLTIFKILPPERLFSLIWNSYSWKLFFTIANIPIFYLAVRIIRLLLK